MSYQSMAAELRGLVPKLPISYAKTLINRAWRTIRERNLWSFLLYEGQWITPPQFVTGLATTTQGSSTVQLDATAQAGLIAIVGSQPYSLITQRQFRISAGGTLSGLYNIWSYNLGTGVMTLDRPFGEPSIASSPFRIYQVYYVPQRNAGPSPEYLGDHKAWISVRNIQLFIDLHTDRYTKTSLDAIDPQRMNFQFPTDVVPYMSDSNPASATYRKFMFELWGAPYANYTYTLFGIRRGLDLVAPSDQLPTEVGEDCVLALARSSAYEWAEGNREHGTGAYYGGPDFKFLAGAAFKEYTTLLSLYRQQDREKVDNWFFVRRSALPLGRNAYYNTISGTASPGTGGYS